MKHVTCYVGNDCFVRLLLLWVKSVLKSRHVEYVVFFTAVSTITCLVLELKKLKRVHYNVSVIN